LALIMILDSLEYTSLIATLIFLILDCVTG
jgi:hypothetical protein